MLEYNRTDVSEELMLLKLMVHAMYYLSILALSEVCVGCHDLMQKDVSFNDAAIVSVIRNEEVEQDKT